MAVPFPLFPHPKRINIKSDTETPILYFFLHLGWKGQKKKKERERENCKIAFQKYFENPQA